MANDYLKARIKDDQIPFILFLRTVNENFGEDKGEKHGVEWRCNLFDSNGSPVSWCDIYQVRFYISKGWKVLGYGNFDILNSEGKPYDQLRDIEGFIRPLVEAQKEIAAMKEQIAASSERGARATKEAR